MVFQDRPLFVELGGTTDFAIALSIPTDHSVRVNHVILMCAWVHFCILFLRREGPSAQK